MSAEDIVVPHKGFLKEGNHDKIRDYSNQHKCITSASPEP